VKKPLTRKQVEDKVDTALTEFLNGVCAVSSVHNINALQMHAQNLRTDLINFIVSETDK
jgi:hypothetical protein